MQRRESDQDLLDRATAIVQLQDLEPDAVCAMVTLREARGEITEDEATKRIIEHHAGDKQ